MPRQASCLTLQRSTCPKHWRKSRMDTTRCTRNAISASRKRKLSCSCRNRQGRKRSRPMNHSPKRKRLPAKRQRKRLQLDTIITLGRRSGGIRPLSFHGIALYNKEQGFTANRLAGLPGGASADMCRHPRKLPFLSLSNCLPIPRRHPLPVLSSVSLFSIYLLSVSVHTCLHRLVFPVAKVDCRAGFRHFEVHFLQNSSFL